MIKTCKQCGAEFNVTLPKHYKTREFCGATCRIKFHTLNRTPADGVRVNLDAEDTARLKKLADQLGIPMFALARIAMRLMLLMEQQGKADPAKLGKKWGLL